VGAKKPRPKRRLGQNFLVQPAVAQRLVDALPISSHDTILELGPGTGALTKILAGQVKRVMALELDEEAVSFLEEELADYGNIEIIHGDMMAASFSHLAKEAGEKLKVVGNLPYNISTQLLIKLIQSNEDILWAALMFQKEVAQRLYASPGSKQYGILSVLLQYCAKVEKLFDVSPGSFFPKPKVNSTVIFVRFISPPNRVHDFDLFTQLVRTAFQQRRKKILNALRNFHQLSTDQIQYALAKANIPTTYRAEQLSVESFVILSNILEKIKFNY